MVIVTTMGGASSYALAFVLLLVVVCGSQISDRRLCGDQECSEPVSYAKTLIRYNSNLEGVLSFKPNENVMVFSKSAGTNQGLWGVQIGEKRGYVPKAFLREYKVLKKDLKYELPTEKSISSTGTQNPNVLHKDNSITTTGTPQNEGSVSPKELSESNSEHAPLFPSNEHDSPEVSKGEVKTEDKPVPLHDGVTQPFELVDGTTIYLPSDEDSQAEPLPIQATMTAGLSSSVQVEAISTSVDSTPKLQPSTLSVQEKTMKSGASSSSSPISAEAEKNLDETLPETEIETEGSSDLYSFISSLISEGSGSGKDNSVSEQVNSMESIEKPLKENLETKEEKQMATNEDEKRTEDEAEDEEDEEDEDDYDDEEYDDEEEENESSQRTPDEKSRIEADSQNEKPLEYQTGYNMLPEKIEVKEGKLSLEILPKSEKFKEDATKTTVSDSSVSDKSEYQKDVEVLFKSLDREENLLHDGTRTEVQIEKEKLFISNNGEQEETSINAEQYHDNTATDEHSTVLTEELSGKQKESHGAEKLTSMLPEYPAPSDHVKEEGIMNTMHSINNIPDIKNEGTEESTKEMATPSSNNMDAQSNLSCTSSAEDLSTESTINDSDRAPFVGELESESSKIANETDRNERQEQYKHEKEIVDESLSREVQPETVVDDALPDEQLISSTENVSPITQETESDYSVDEISTAPTDDSFDEAADTGVKENIKVEPEIISEEQYSSGLFSGITDSFWSSFGNLVHIFVDGSESTGPDDANVEEAQTLGERHDEAVSSQWSELQPSSDSFAKKEETQACAVDTKAAVGIDSDCDDIGALSRANKKTEIDSLKSQETDEPFNMDVQKSFNTVLYLIITAVTVLLFSLGHYYMEKKRRDGSLVAKINELEKALLVSSKECIILKDDLEATKEKLQSIEHSSTDSIETVATLNIQLQESKVANAALEEQVASLEKELEQATEAGLELNRMLTEFLSTQHGSESLMKSVEHLQKQLDSQQGTITTMTESLNEKNVENENLQTELKLANEKVRSLEEELQEVTEKLHIMETEKMKIIQESSDKSKEFQIRIEEIKTSKEEEISLLHFELQAIQDSVLEMKDNLVTKDSEIAVLQDCIKQMKNYDDGDDTLQALLDVGETKAELKLMTLERNTLLEKLQIEEDARKLLEDHVKVIKEEVVRLRESYEEAEKEKTEAQTRLEVLSNYFKEKETQLQKELGLQEAMCLQREGDATSTHERIKSLQEEIENYKSQNEALKKEILDQERGLKGQISSLEKKAHENWIAARQAERKLEETKQEAGQLRNRLTVVEKNITNVSKNGEPAIMNDRMPADSNGDIGTSPVHTGIATLADSSSSPLHYHDGLPSPPLPVMLSSQPLPPSSFMGMHPGVFIPPPPPPGAPFMPPPPPLFPGDRRPPPLGRMSSPPPPRRYSSPPPPTESRSTFSPYEHSPPPSPLSSDRLYRSPPPPINDSPSRFKHTSPPPPLPHFSTRLPPHWDDPHGIPRSGFRPLPPPTHRDSPREQKGSNLSSGHSSESLEKSSRHSGRV